MNIELNFVYNANVRLGRYEVALESFMKVLNVKSDHAIALFYVGFCHEQLGNADSAKDYFMQARKICEDTDFWDVYINDFDIPIYDKSSEIGSKRQYSYVINS